MEALLGHDFSTVRVHADPAAAASARSLFARAYAFGKHVVFGEGEYAPRSPEGRRLLAHELAHVVQQQRGLTETNAGLEREARAAERRDRSPITAHRGRLGVTPPAPLVQLQDDRAAIRARLEAVRARLVELRRRHQELSDAFAKSAVDERLRESGAAGAERLRAQVRSDKAARQLWGGTFAASRIRRAVSASLSGTTATLTANIQLTYLALSEQAGRQQATIDIPRIDAAIRDVWQVDIATGEYAGVRFRLAPKISFVPNTAARTDAFLIQVRAPDTGPSSGDSVSGTISLAPAHLQGSRVVVVAHELAHLFGFVDVYLMQMGKGAQSSTVVGASVARQDPRDRPDLLGMIDPVVLARWRKQGAITKQQLERQSRPVHVWEEEASIVLGTLGVAPPPPPRPTPESEDFDPQVELDRIRREGEARLGDIRRRRERIENTLESLRVSEEIIKLEGEERALNARLGSSP